MKAYIESQHSNEVRQKIARLRSAMFGLSESEQDEAGREIESLKASCADEWHALAVQKQADRLTSMGY